MHYRQSHRSPQKKSVVFTAPGLVIGALAVSAAGATTVGDLLASWSGSDGAGQSCNIKCNMSIKTGERIFHVPGQRYYSPTKISPQYGERWFCSEFEAWAVGGESLGCNHSPSSKSLSREPAVTRRYSNQREKAEPPDGTR